MKPVLRTRFHHATPRMMAINGGVLVVFDYDWSLVEANSDRFLLRTLSPALLQKLRARRGRVPWTELVTELLDELITQGSVTREIIERTVADIPVQERMIDAMKLAARYPDSAVAIVSQANTVFIECMLAKHELQSLVAKVVANPATWETDPTLQQQRLSVQPFHPADRAPHGCRHCPVNMCKGVVLDQLRREHEPQRIIYIGDGSVDFCPVLRLTERDVVLARAGSHDGRPFALLPMLQAQSDKIKASVVPWRTGHDIFAQFVEIFGS